MEGLDEIIEIEDLYKKSLKKLSKIYPKIESKIEDLDETEAVAWWNYVQLEKEDLTDNNFFEL